MPERPAPFAAGGEPSLRGESVGQGPPIVLCHGLTATRRYVVHGSRVLERAGHSVVRYDARGHGESDPPPAGRGYGYPRLVDDLEAVLAATVGGGPFVVVGHSMGAHTALAYALRNPARVAGLVLVGPVYAGEIEEAGLAYWDGLADALQASGVEGFVEYIDRNQPIDSAWRDSMLRFTRERMLAHRHPDALVEALREVPRSRPFDGLAELDSVQSPALVVASRDDADPGHPRSVAETYAQAMPGAQLVGEAEGQSPLAWQGGRLSREIAAFCAQDEVAARLGET